MEKETNKKNRDALYEARIKEEREIKRQLIRKEMNDWLSTLKRDELDKPYVVIGSKSYTPHELLKHVEEETEIGKLVEKALDKGRIELIKRRG